MCEKRRRKSILSHVLISSKTLGLREGGTGGPSHTEPEEVRLSRPKGFERILLLSFFRWSRPRQAGWTTSSRTRSSTPHVTGGNRWSSRPIKIVSEVSTDMVGYGGMGCFQVVFSTEIRDAFQEEMQGNSKADESRMCTREYSPSPVCLFVTHVLPVLLAFSLSPFGPGRDRVSHRPRDGQQVGIGKVIKGWDEALLSMKAPSWFVSRGPPFCAVRGVTRLGRMGCSIWRHLMP